MALKLNLKPGERIIVNGAVLSAGNKAVELVFHNQARILQEKHILTPERIQDILASESQQSITPSWLYYVIQLMYIDPEDAGRYMDKLADTIARMRQEMPEQDHKIEEILGLMGKGELYRALRTCRKAFPGCLGASAATQSKEEPAVAKTSSAYDQQAPSEDSDPREIEAWALMKSARRLDEARRDPTNKDELRESLRFNQILWTIFQTAVTEPDCPLPREVRENVLKLSVLVDKRTFSCLGDLDVDKMDFLIDLNRNVALGLMEKPENPEAPGAAGPTGARGGTGGTFSAAPAFAVNI